MLSRFLRSSIITKNQFNLAQRSMASGFYRTSEEMSKSKKMDLSDENINNILRQAENNKEWTTDADPKTLEEQKNVLKANKKMKKMVPQDVEKFD